MNQEREDAGTEERGGKVVERCTREFIAKFEKELSSSARAMLGMATGWVWYLRFGMGWAGFEPAPTYTCCALYLRPPKMGF